MSYWQNLPLKCSILLVYTWYVCNFFCCCCQKKKEKKGKKKLDRRRTSLESFPRRFIYLRTNCAGCMLLRLVKFQAIKFCSILHSPTPRSIFLCPFLFFLRRPGFILISWRYLKEHGYHLCFGMDPKQTSWRFLK